MTPERFVLDSSVTLAWCFNDEETPDTSAILKAVDCGEWQALVPSLWPYEIVNVLLIARRRQRITEAQMNSFIGNLNFIGIAFFRTNILVQRINSLLSFS